MILLQQAVNAIAARLGAAGIEEARREARIILAAALGTDAAGLLTLELVDPAIYEALVARRETREPLAYILGRREFWGLSFQTSPATLIPRPDSETLIEAAIAVLPDKAAVQTILDFGTGTGCLLLAALTEFPAAFGVGVDISPAATALARGNAAALGLGGRASFLAGNWADAVDASFNLILCNPPYIPGRQIATLMPEVARFEPRAALDGGADGIDSYTEIIAGLQHLLAEDGAAVLELGAGQAQLVIPIAVAAGFAPGTAKDLSGQDRAIILTRPK